MKKTSLRFLQTHTNMTSVIGELAPDLFGEGYEDNGDKMLYSLFVETVEQVPIAISITDKKAKILYVNKEFCQSHRLPA